MTYVHWPRILGQRGELSPRCVSLKSSRKVNSETSRQRLARFFGLLLKGSLRRPFGAERLAAGGGNSVDFVFEFLVVFDRAPNVKGRGRFGHQLISGEDGCVGSLAVATPPSHLMNKRHDDRVRQKQRTGKRNMKLDKR